jgi:GTPase
MTTTAFDSTKVSKSYEEEFLISFLASLMLQDGNTEYKRQLHNCTAARLEKLKTQMSYRLDEGIGCCIYRIGVEDDGCHSLLDYEACEETARLLECLARSLNSVVLERKMIQEEVANNDAEVAVRIDGDPIIVIEPSLLGDGRDQMYEEDEFQREEKSTCESDVQQELNKEAGAYTRAELTIQRIETHLLDPSPLSLAELSKEQEGGHKITGKEDSVPKSVPVAKPKQGGENLSVAETLSSRNIRVAVVGNVDAGKSTMIGTLTSSCLDDGRGSSRTSIMKHRHEIESGRTSTATTHLMGFRSTGEVIAGRDSIRGNRRKTEDEVARESYRVITLMDLAGHEKYLKTT